VVPAGRVAGAAPNLWRMTLPTSGVLGSASQNSTAAGSLYGARCSRQ
jgi:hypothetical protein